MDNLLLQTCSRDVCELSVDQQKALHHQIPDWENIEGRRIQREYRFKSYLDGVSWVAQIAPIAESQDHHPEIRILYRRVLVVLWTHTVKGLSANDYILAAKFDQSFASYLVATR